MKTENENGIIKIENKKCGDLSSMVGILISSILDRRGGMGVFLKRYTLYIECVYHARGILISSILERRGGSGVFLKRYLYIWSVFTTHVVYLF